MVRDLGDLRLVLDCPQVKPQKLREFLVPKREFKNTETKGLNKYENKTLSKAIFVLEECFFLNCVLSDCDVFYSGGDVDWVNLRFENCRWHFRGAAQKTMQLLTTIGMLKMQPMPVSFQANTAKAN